MTVDILPPWQEPAEWRECHDTLSHTISTHAALLGHARTLAGTIQKQLVAVSDFMEGLSAETCTHCPVVCCLSARIWADFKDALFWHFSGQAIPLRQNISHENQVCRYVSNRGCVLPRLSRPFVCSWYLCPTQVSRIQTGPEYYDLPGLRNTLTSIKSHRQNMENAFIEAVS